MAMDQCLAVQMRVMMLDLLANTLNVQLHSSSSTHWMLPSLPSNVSSSLVTLVAMIHPLLTSRSVCMHITATIITRSLFLQAPLSSTTIITNRVGALLPNAVKIVGIR
jgi:hypothetical protein